MEKKLLLSSPKTHGEELQYVHEAFEKNWVAPLGFNCDGFESEMEDYLTKLSAGDCDKLHALSLSSGTAALHIAVKLAGVKPGDRVFCSDTTFSATVNPISYEGGQQVFIDSELETWNMDPDALQKAFEKYPDTKVVMLAHLYGTPAKMDEITDICNRYGAILIEDAAEALAATYKGKACGTFGKYSVLSFNGNKIITTSGGGMLLCKEKAKRDRALYLVTQAREPAPWYQHTEIGYNYRMSNIVAGIGRGQLIHVDEHRELKEKIYCKYKEAFKDLPVTMNPYIEGVMKPNFWLSSILIDKGQKVTYMDIYNKLKENNVESRPIWKPMHMQPVFKDKEFIYVKDKPVNEGIFERGLCIPSDINMTDEELDYVIGIIKSCF